MKQFIIQKMAVKNLTRRPVRSWSMIFFVFMLSFSLMLSTVLVDSMKAVSYTHLTLPTN